MKTRHQGGIAQSSVVRYIKDLRFLSQSFQLPARPRTPLCEGSVNSCHFFLKHHCKVGWILSLIGSNIGFCCRVMLHNRAFDDHSVSRKVGDLLLQHVPRNSKSWTPCMRPVAGTNFSQDSCCASEKVSAYIRECVVANMSLPSNMYPRCVLNAIFSLLHFVATCSLVWAHRKFIVVTVFRYLNSIVVSFPSGDQHCKRKFLWSIKYKPHKSVAGPWRRISETDR